MGYKDELKQKKRRKFLAKLTAILIIKAVSFSVAAYFLFFTDHLRVANLHLDSGDENLTNTLRTTVQDWLNENSWGLNWHGNLLLLSAADLRDFLYGKFPTIADIEITKRFPHDLDISVKEKEHQGTWCLSGQLPVRCFQFDWAGKAFRETLPSTGFLIFTVLDYRPRSIEIGRPVAEDNWFWTLVLARENLLKYNMRPGEFIIPADSFDEFQVKTSEGRTILFSTSTDIARQLDALAQFLHEREKDNSVARLEYVDLRIQDRIYFK